MTMQQSKKITSVKTEHIQMQKIQKITFAQKQFLQILAKHLLKELQKQLT